MARQNDRLADFKEQEYPFYRLHVTENAPAIIAIFADIRTGKVSKIPFFTAFFSQICSRRQTRTVQLDFAKKPQRQCQMPASLHPDRTLIQRACTGGLAPERTVHSILIYPVARDHPARCSLASINVRGNVVSKRLVTLAVR